MPLVQPVVAGQYFTHGLHQRRGQDSRIALRRPRHAHKAAAHAQDRRVQCLFATEAGEALQGWTGRSRRYWAPCWGRFAPVNARPECEGAAGIHARL